MSNVISLSKHRKARERAKTRSDADSNALKFGRTKSEKHREASKAEKDKRDLDGHETE